MLNKNKNSVVRSVWFCCHCSVIPTLIFIPIPQYQNSLGGGDLGHHNFVAVDV